MEWYVTLRHKTNHDNLIKVVVITKTEPLPEAATTSVYAKIYPISGNTPLDGQTVSSTRSENHALLAALIFIQWTHPDYYRDTVEYFEPDVRDTSGNMQ